MKSDEYVTDIEVGLSEVDVENLIEMNDGTIPKRQILVVDDNNVNCMILNRMLSDDYSVIQASNGKEAITLLNEQRIKVSAILLDIFMPEMDGYEFLKYRNEEAELKQIPVIVLSRAESRDNELRALELGANDFLRKPYEPMIIRIRLSNLIEHREAVERQATLMRVLDDLPGGIAVCLVEESIKLIFFNEGLIRMRGYSDKQLRRQYDSYFLSCVHEEDRESLEKLLFTESFARREINAVYRTIRPDGEVRWNRMNARCAANNDTHAVYFAQILDITE